MALTVPRPPAGTPGAYGAPGTGGLRRGQVRVVFVGLMLALVLAALDQTIVATALPTIAGDLHGLAHLSWIVTAYLLGSTVVMPLYGKFGDVFGRKRTFQAAITVFLAGSMLSGLAGSITELVVFRAVQGLGGGGLMICAQAIIGDIVSPRERGRYQGLTSAAFGLSSVAGPLLGGFFVDQLSWRWIFYVNVPIGLVAVAVIGAVLRVPSAPARPRIDYAGAVLVSAAITCLVLVTAWGGTRYGWGSAPILGLAVATVGFTLVWLAAERRAADPVVPLRLFADRSFAVANAVSFLVGVAMFCAVTFLPTFLQVVDGASATRSGLLLLPLIGGTLVAGVVAGQLVSRTGRYKRFPVAGTALAAIGMFGLSRMDADTSRSLASVDMAVFGAGIGLVLPILVLAVQNGVDRRDLGAATSSVNFLRTIGSSVGVALVGSLFAHRLAAGLPGSLADRLSGGRGGGGGPESLTPQALANVPPDAHARVVTTFAHALPPLFGLGIPLLLAACVLTLFMVEHPLRAHAHVPVD